MSKVWISLALSVPLTGCLQGAPSSARALVEPDPEAPSRAGESLEVSIVKVMTGEAHASAPKPIAPAPAPGLDCPDKWKGCLLSETHPDYCAYKCDDGSIKFKRR